jgi:quercetin dioxygenase-like cupin family protein
VVQEKYYEWSFGRVRSPRYLPNNGGVRVTAWTRIGIATFVGLSTAVLLASGAEQDRTSRSRTAFSGKLPALDGKRLEATILEVTYPPGGANPAHRHPCPVIGYVLEGAVRMQVKGQPERIVKPGETFLETPSDVHLVSANASQDAPARFLAYFLCDRVTPLSVPATDAEQRP